MRRERLTQTLLVGLLGSVTFIGACAPGQNTASVKAALEQRYEQNRTAFLTRDSSAVMRLRHPDFHAIDSRGQKLSYPDFAIRTGLMLRVIERFDTLTFHINSLTVRGDTAIAMVRQRTVRKQRLADGASHVLQTGSVQREWWVRTGDGWLMWYVDQVRPDPVVVDGRARIP